MKNILLLGGNGFIGKNLREYFGKCPDLYLIDHPSHRELDLIDSSAVAQFLRKKYYDVIINAAVCNPLGSGVPTGATELAMDLRMFYNLERCQDLYGKMVYFGSGAEFNKSKPICSVTEFEFLNGVPLSEYGIAKYTIGKAIEQSKNIYNFRLFGLFGKYEEWRKSFISNACCKALKGIPITIRQNVYFDYLYISDFCKVIEWFINTELKEHTYNVTSGNRIDLVTIAEMVKEVSGSDVPVYVCREGFANEYTANNDRLRKEFEGFVVSDFKETVKDLYNYYELIKSDIDLYSLLYYM